MRAIEGLGFLLCVLPVPSLIRQLVPPSRLALHLGLWGTYMAAGTSLVLAAGPLLMGVIGWQGTVVALAMASAAVAAWLFLRVPSDRVRRAAITAIPGGGRGARAMGAPARHALRRRGRGGWRSPSRCIRASGWR